MPKARCVVVTSAAVVVGAVVLGCGQDDEQPAQSARILDERARTYEGVALGDRAAAVRAAMGKPGEVSRTTLPLVGDPYSLGLPGGAPPPAVDRGDPAADIRALRYRDVVFVVSGRAGVFTITASGSGVRSARGLRIGDRLKRARELYPTFRCGVRNRNTEFVEYPFCTGRVSADTVLWIGQDPVASMTLSSTPLYG